MEQSISVFLRRLSIVEALHIQYQGGPALEIELCTKPMSAGYFAQIIGTSARWSNVYYKLWFCSRDLCPSSYLTGYVLLATSRVIFDTQQNSSLRIYESYKVMPRDGASLSVHRNRTG